MVTVRLLLAMTLGAAVATAGALFLGEYEFTEVLPMAMGLLLAYVVAEIVVSLGRHRSPMLGAIVATWSATAVVLAGWLDTNGVEPIAVGAYGSAAAAAAVGFLRAGDLRGTWRAAEGERRAEIEAEWAAHRAATAPAPAVVARDEEHLPSFARARPAAWVRGERQAPEEPSEAPGRWGRPRAIASDLEWAPEDDADGTASDDAEDAAWEDDTAWDDAAADDAGWDDTAWEDDTAWNGRGDGTGRDDAAR